MNVEDLILNTLNIPKVLHFVERRYKGITRRYRYWSGSVDENGQISK